MSSLVCTNYSDFPLPHKRPWPVSVVVAERMTQGDLFLHAGSEWGLGSFIASLVVTNYCLKFAFSPQVSLFSSSSSFISDDLFIISHVCLGLIGRGDTEMNELITSRHAQKLPGTNTFTVRSGPPPVALPAPVPCLSFSFPHVLFFSLGTRINNDVFGVSVMISLSCVYSERK